MQSFTLSSAPGAAALCLLAFVGSSISGCASTADATEIGTPGRRHISYAAGVKFKESAWSPGETETVIGFLDIDHYLGWIPFWFVGKLLVGSSDAPEGTTDPDADSAGTGELCLGLRKYAPLGRAEFFGSCGLSMLTGGITGYDEQASDAFSIDESASLGAWVDAGVQLPITKSFVVGLVAHHSVGGELELEGLELQPGGTSLLITLGWRH